MTGPPKLFLGASALLPRTWGEHGTYLPWQQGAVNGTMQVKYLEQHLACGSSPCVSVH